MSTPLDIISNNGPYNVVYADPPWHYNDKLNCGNRGSAHKYHILSTKDLCSIRVADICDKDAVLFLWVCPPLKELADLVVREWGFTYKTAAFTWIKLTKDCKKARMGMGHWTRSNAEFVYLATKGKPHKNRVNAGINSTVLTPLTKPFSSKPPIVRNRIERLMRPDSKRLELFARGKRDGWTSTGYESDGLDFMEIGKIL